MHSVGWTAAGHPKGPERSEGAAQRLDASTAVRHPDSVPQNLTRQPSNNPITTASDTGSALSSESSFHLSLAWIDASGRFRGTTVRWAHPDATVTSTEGSWAGQFSNVAVNGDPCLVAGTVGAHAQTSLGTEVVFVGAW